MKTQEQNMAEIYKSLLAYQQDPIGMGVNILGIRKEFVWPKMVEVCEAVRDHQKVAVRAGHSVSKTFTVGRVIVPWFKVCFQPSTVITTAPGDNQVRNQLWREIHAAYAAAQANGVPLGGKMHATLWDYKPKDSILETLDAYQRPNWEKNFAIGFSTSPDSTAEHATRMQGWHNEYLLAIMDEACGILPQIWRTVMEGLIVDEHCKVLAIGNPTDPECDFAKACHSSDRDKNDGNTPYISDDGWYVITIAGTDTPNYKARKRIIPGLAGYDYVASIIRKYGPDGDGTRYRVRGLFPTFKEGTYYGAKLSKARKDGRVGKYDWDDAAPVYTFSDFGDMYTATIFVQFLRGKPRIIDDYWDYEGMGITAWAKACQSKPYVYATKGHYAGPDFITSNAKSGRDSRTTKDFAASLGFDINSVSNESFDDGIECGRSTFGQLEISETAITFLKAIAGYGKKKNQALSTDDQVVYHNNPAQTWHRHMADAYRHMAIFYRLMRGDDGSKFGSFTTERYYDDYGDNVDLLGMD
jgi:hypothetical protein